MLAWAARAATHSTAMGSAGDEIGAYERLEEARQALERR
jgi:hypothetical protein